MDMNGYALETIARAYQAERRAEAQRIHQVRSAAGRPTLRVTLGRTLIRLGHRLEGGLRAARAAA